MNYQGGDEKVLLCRQIKFGNSDLPSDCLFHQPVTSKWWHSPVPTKKMVHASHPYTHRVNWTPTICVRFGHNQSHPEIRPKRGTWGKWLCPYTFQSVQHGNRGPRRDWRNLGFLEVSYIFVCHPKKIVSVQTMIENSSFSQWFGSTLPHQLVCYWSIS